MDFSKISRVIDCYDAEDANNHLSLGWILLGVSSGNDSYGFVCTRYSLGWPSEKGEPAYCEPNWKPNYDAGEDFISTLYGDSSQ